MSDSKPVIRVGTRGGKYYVNATGRKVYVDRRTRATVADGKASGGGVGGGGVTTATRVTARTRGRRREEQPLPKKGTLLGSKTVVGAVHVRAWSPKRNRQYERVLQSILKRIAAGQSNLTEADARRIAAATVNRTRSIRGETKI